MSSCMSRRKFLKTSAQAGVLIGLAGESLFGKTLSASSDFDLVIRNGTIIDGIQNQAFHADIGIIGEQIRAIGNLQKSMAKKIIDATDRIVSPGFIDIHSHTDAELAINPKAESKVRQGVTSELGGNCGSSPFPLRDHSSQANKEWKDLEAYHSALGEKGMAINHASLIGHGTLRSSVMGEENRKPSVQELDIMKEHVSRAMKQGAFGISTGLEYTPSGFAEPQEIIELCKSAGKHGGFYATHIRSEDQYVLEAVGEAIHIAESAGLPLQISHLKASGEPNWWKVPQILGLIEKARERGVDVHADRYPYTAYSTGLSVFFPGWARDGGSERLVERLKNKEIRARMRDETEKNVEANNSWKSILIVEVNTSGNRGWEGTRIHKAAAQRNQDPFEFACDLLIEEGGNVSIVGFGMSEDNTQFILKHPLVMLCSDGSALAPYGSLSKGVPHPRNYGTFPRFLRLYVRKKNLVSLPEAVKKMTSMPAQKMGLSNRGIIKEGTFADIVVFNPETIDDKATYTHPEQYPEGIDIVIVNGKVVIDHGQHTELMAGKILFGPGKKA